MRYYVWDTDVAKLLGAYPTEAEALSLVRTLVAHYGDEYAEDLSVGIERDDGVAGQPLSGADLIARVATVLAHAGTAVSQAADDGPGAVTAVLPRPDVAGATPMTATGDRGHGRGAELTVPDASERVEAPNRRRRSG